MHVPRLAPRARERHPGRGPHRDADELRPHRPAVPRVIGRDGDAICLHDVDRRLVDRGRRERLLARPEEVRM